ncbi:MAG: hypothetical protein AB1421_13395 [Pseudomonadota bacterium]
MPSLFASPAHLDEGFADGLARMLEVHDGLGVYILVLANAAYDPALWARLRPALALRHARHGETLTNALRAGRRIAEPDDDLLVFLKLMALGFDRVACLEGRACGPWQVLFNPIRALRPPRASGERIEGLQRPFNPAGFHFNKPFLAKEVLWQGPLAGKDARLLYNKFPFAPLHGLLVPEPQAQRPQWLSPEMLGWAWDATAELGAGLPGFGLAYNSLGAQASVNHLHFQTFMGAPALPLLSPDFRHNGGTTDYPLPCQVATRADEAWLFLDELHQQSMPYNLVYTPGRVHILPRRTQGSLPLPAWSAGLAWSELAGSVTVFSREDFEALTEPDIHTALSLLAP